MPLSMPLKSEIKNQKSEIRTQQSSRLSALCEHTPLRPDEIVGAYVTGEKSQCPL